MKKLIGLSLVAACFVGACAPIDAAWEKGVKPTMTAQDSSLKYDYYQDAVTAIGRHDYDEALLLLQAASSQNPHDVRILNAYGVVFDKLGKFDVSEKYYSQANALDPSSKIIANNIAYSKHLKAEIQTDVAKNGPPQVDISQDGPRAAALPTSVSVRDVPAPQAQSASVSSGVDTSVRTNQRPEDGDPTAMGVQSKPRTTIYYPYGMRRAALRLGHRLLVPFRLQMTQSSGIRVALAQSVSLKGRQSVLLGRLKKVKSV